MINMKYHSQAMRRLGYESTTVVAHIYDIHSREDYDVLTSELVEAMPLGQTSAATRPEAGRAIRHVRVGDPQLRRLHDLHDRHDPAAHAAQISRAATAPPGREEGRAPRLRRRRAGDEPLPRSSVQARDVHGLSAVHAAGGADAARHGVLRRPLRPRHERRRLGRLHASLGQSQRRPLRHRHRPVDSGTGAGRAGTRQADRDLPRAESPGAERHALPDRGLRGARAEGEPIELRLVERVPNTEIRRQLAEADIVADQFIVGWYALFAIEAMAMAKPTLCFLREDLLELYTLYSFAGECPLDQYAGPRDQGGTTSADPRCAAPARARPCRPPLRRELTTRSKRSERCSTGSTGSVWPESDHASAP